MKRKNNTITQILCLIPFLVVSSALSLEPPAVAWEFVYPPSSPDQSSLGTAYHAIQLADGSYVMAGEYGWGIYCLIHLNQYGNPNWVWNGDVAGISSVRWVEEDSGSLITTGSWNNVYGRRLMLARVSYSGNTVWRKTYNQLGRSWGMCLTVLPDSSIIVGGRLYSESSYIPLLVRASSDGTMLAMQSFEEYSGTVTRVIHHNDLVYAFINTVNEAPILLAANPTTLAEEWAVDYSGQLPEDEGSICEPYSQSGILMVAGEVQAKLGNEGQILWESEPPGSNNRTLYSASATFDGGYILSGIVNMSLSPEIEYHPYDGWLIRTDGAGNTLWWLADSAGNENTFYYSAEQTDGGGYIVAGSRCFPDNKRAILVVRYEPEMGFQGGSSLEHACLTVSPNPFAQHINITYSLPVTYTAQVLSEVSLRVLDLSGREIHSFGVSPGIAGEQSTTWTPAQDVPDGCYILVLAVSEERVIRRAVYLR